MGQLLFAFFLAFFIVSTTLAQPSFPALTGRVVDNAHIISPNEKNNLEEILAQHEQKTSNQLVVVTLPSLQGLTIEDYGYKLGRAWGIGQKGKNNGVLLIVAPNDRTVRIEVGYGLEGVLTDAITSQIIQTIILPKLKNKDYSGGIADGASAIINVMVGKSIGYQKSDIYNDFKEEPVLGIIFVLIFIRIIIGIISSFLLVLFSILSALGMPFLLNRFEKILNKLGLKFGIRKGFGVGFGGRGSKGGGGSSGRW